MERENSSLLIAEPQVAFLPSLAVLYGHNEALLLQQVHYWSVSPFDNRIAIMPHQGRTWVKIPPKAFLDKAHGPLRFMSSRTLDRTIASARDQGVLMSEQLTLDEGDPTNWYAIEYKELGRKVEAYKCTLEVKSKIKMGTSKRRDGSRQNGGIPIHDPSATMAKSLPSERRKLPVPSRRNDHDNEAESYKEESLSKKVQQQEMAAPVVADNSIINDLTTIGITRNVAAELARARPDECRRQLDYLPHRKGRTSPAATLVKAIRENWAAPEGWTAQQDALDAAEARQREIERQAEERGQDRQRETREREKSDAANVVLDAMYDRLDSKKRAALDAEAKERLGVLGNLGRSEAGLQAMRRTLLRERLGTLEDEVPEPEPVVEPPVPARNAKPRKPKATIEAQGGLFGDN